MNNHTLWMVIKTIQAHLISSGYSRESAWWLLQALTGQPKATLIAQQSMLTDAQKNQLMQWLDQIAKRHMPLAYIIGTLPFANLELTIKPPILIPRPETEEWVMWLIKQLHPAKEKPLRILDIGTGSGCIGLALAHALPNVLVTATDISVDALELAHHNQTKLGIPNITFLPSDLFTKLGNQQFDLIVSNPPYIAYYEKEFIDQSVMQWEDHAALFAQENGMHILKKIAEQAAHYLKPNHYLEELGIGNVILEIGHTHADSMQQFMQGVGYQNIIVHTDSFGRNRWVMGRIPNESDEG